MTIPASAQSVCGNGVREFGEQCDDGNTKNADGCSAQCRFEQNQRMTQLKIQFGTSGTCTDNAFGGSIVGTATRNQLQSAIDASVGGGQTSVLLVMLGLDDLTGANDAAVQVGVVNGTPVAPHSGTTYDGTNDLDWWYLPVASDIDADRLPLSQLSGTVASHMLTAGPAPAALLLGGTGLDRVFMSSLRIRAASGGATIPATATGTWPPGHVTLENVDPVLTSYAVSGGGVTGEMCGNLSAASLAALPIPQPFTTTICSPNYVTDNTMLDLFVGGCRGGILGDQIAPTQPDAVDPAAPVAGGGPPYVFSTTALHVDSCSTNGGIPAPLADCLAAAAYSSYFKFSTDRVIEKDCPAAPVAGNDGPFCAGTTAHLTASGPAGDYEWSGPNGFTSNEQNPSIPSFSAANEGTYTVTVTVAGCTSAAGSTNLNLAAAVAPTIDVASSAAAGQTLVARTYASGTAYTWSIANGVITAGQGTAEIMFTAGTSGQVDLTLTISATGGCTSPPGSASVAIVFDAPQNVIATATLTTSVTLTWTPTIDAVGYEITRQEPGGTSLAGTSAAASFDDNGLTPAGAYLYSVVAIDSGGRKSAASIPDLATTVIFTDDPLAAGTTIVKMAHINELRTAVNAVRALTPLGAFSFTDPTLTTDTPIKAVHVSELRTALDQARANLALTALVYTDPTLTGGTMLIKAAHVQEIREGVK